MFGTRLGSSDLSTRQIRNQLNATKYKLNNTDPGKLCNIPKQNSNKQVATGKLVRRRPPRARHSLLYHSATAV